MLEDRLELVQALGQPRLGRLGRLVLLPESHDFVGHRLRQRLHELQQILPLPGRLVVVGALLHGRDVAAEGLPQVVDDTELQEPPVVHLRVGVADDDGHEAEAPGVLGHALRRALRGPGATQRRLEPLGGAEEVEESVCVDRFHGVWGRRPERAQRYGVRPRAATPFGPTTAELSCVHHTLRRESGPGPGVARSSPDGTSGRRTPVLPA